MPITVRCPIHNIQAEFEDRQAAEDAGWRCSRYNDEWYSPDAMEHGTFCDDCGRYQDWDSDDYYSDTDEDNSTYCCDCWDENGGYWCPRCEQNHWNSNYAETRVIIHNEFYPDGYEEYWCSECAAQDAEWNNDEDCYEYYYIERRRSSMNNAVHRDPEGVKPELCELCKSNYIRGQGVCEKCLKNQAYNKELRETTLWVYDTRFARTRWYHPGDHVQFKTTVYRDKGEHPFLYYGIEVEVGFNVINMQPSLEEVAKHFIELTNGMFVAESDSSIGNGIEFISRPTSYKMWTKPETIQMLRKAFEYLKEQGALVEQPDTNGIHIHMSRRFFERNTEKKPIEINRDLDWVFQYYQPEIEVISQRKFTRFCESKMDQIKNRISNNMRYAFNAIEAKISINAEMSKSELQSGRDNHHAAITMRDETIEVRCFKSSINVDTIISYIEFVRNIAHTVRNKDIKNMTLEQILESKDSPRLDTYIYNLKRHKNLVLDRKVKDKMKKEFKTEDLVSAQF